MKYQIQHGVVLQNVCDEYLLIATGEARAVCPSARQINSGAAYYWKLLQSGMTEEEMLDAAAAEYEVPVETLRPGLIKFLERLSLDHYLIPQT